MLLYPILNKREAFRAAFADFNMDRVACFDESDVKRLLLNAGIMRHAGKIASTINNAQRAKELRREFGSLGSYFWQFEPDPESHPATVAHQALTGITTSPESIAMSKDLKKRGWSFVGPTTMYAFMQAMGMVNDHIHGCYARMTAQGARSAFKSPALKLP
jgi:DNA-3-methyladenine glycosylase I